MVTSGEPVIRVSSPQDGSSPRDDCRLWPRLWNPPDEGCGKPLEDEGCGKPPEDEGCGKPPEDEGCGKPPEDEGCGKLLQQGCGKLPEAWRLDEGW